MCNYLSCILIVLTITSRAMAQVVSATARAVSALAQAVSHQPLTVEAQVPFQASSCGIHGGQSSTWSGFPQSTSVLPVSFHHAPYSYFIHLSPMLYSVSS